MKILLACITSISISLSANDNWIKIQPSNQKLTTNSNTIKEINLSQIKPIGYILKNATAIKQLIDATNKKKEQTINDKNWFVLNKDTSK